MRAHLIAIASAVCLALVAAAGAATAPTAGAVDGVRHARSGRVSAELTFRSSAAGVSDVHLRIVRSGATLVDYALPGVGEPDRIVGFLARDLDGDGEPEVLLSDYTGGAYCCTETRIYRYAAATNTYLLTSEDWGSFGYRLADLGGGPQPELASRDVRVDQVFTAHVISSAPLRILRYQAGDLLDVTRNFPARVQADLAGARSDYLRGRGDRTLDLRGLLVAYVGDLYLLGRGAEAGRVLAAAQRNGELGRGDFGPQDAGYVRALLALLHTTGYVRTVTLVRPAGRCSETGDVCTGLDLRAGRLVLGITTAARYFASYRLCVTPPRGPKTCRTFPIVRSGTEYGSQIDWAGAFPAAGPGVYRVSWDGLGSTYSFRVS